MNKFALLGHDVGNGTRELLTQYGYTVLCMPNNPYLVPALSAHPDLSVFFAKEFILTTRFYYETAKFEFELLSAILRLPVKIVVNVVNGDYHDDIFLDALPVGNCLFCLPEYTAGVLTELPEYTVVPVRQGYAKCTALPVGDHALVTADPSILRSAEQVGVETLRISEGFIGLDGYEYGFIGGASSFAPYGGIDKIFFSGDLSSHPDCRKITDFLASHGYEAVWISEEPLRDIGTIFLFPDKFE